MATTTLWKWYVAFVWSCQLRNSKHKWSSNPWRSPTGANLNANIELRLYHVVSFTSLESIFQSSSEKYNNEIQPMFGREFMNSLYIDCSFMTPLFSKIWQIVLTLCSMSLFGAAYRMGEGKKPLFPKICPTYPPMMKLGTIILHLKKIRIHINDVAHSLSSADISIFSRKSTTFVISRNTDMDCILIHNF